MTDEENEAIEWLKRLVKLNKRDNLDDTFAEILLNLIEKQSKEIEELKEKKGYHLGFIDGGIAKKYEIQDKIKAKIEELKLIADNGANAVRFAMTHDDEVERIQKQKDISAMIDILQSLLEKE